MFAQLSRSGTPNQKIMGRAEAEALGSRPSQDRGTTISAKFSKRWELSSLLLLLLACCYPIQVSMPAVAIPKATVFNFSSLDIATD